MKSNKKLSMINVETIIIIAIAACVLFLNVFTSNKLSSLKTAGEEAMFIMDGLEYPESDKFREEILKYRPDSCKMIEMYNSDFKLLFSLQFDDAHSIQNGNMIDHPKLLEVLNSSNEGQTSIEMDGYTENIYFQWINNDHEEKRLIIIYSCLEEVEHLWIFKMVCYIILILLFFLLIRLHLKEYKMVVNNYKRVSKHAMDEIIR